MAYPGQATLGELHANDIPVVERGCQRAKGKNFRELDTGELKTLHWYYKKVLDDPEKARWRGEAQAWLNAVEAEMARREHIDEQGADVAREDLPPEVSAPASDDLPF